jgi:8-oxo-dGTP diphosphatase
MPITLKTSGGESFSIDWAAWQPTESAVLTFIEEGDNLLLIHKKRGLGAGLFNAPGGRIDPGETPEQAAVRETEEEICVTPSGLNKAGILDFAFTDGYSLRCHVFKTKVYTGTPAETAEAIPSWFNKDHLPYGRMWSDDRVWIPLMLANRPFTAQFIFEKELMLWHLLHVALWP